MWGTHNKEGAQITKVEHRQQTWGTDNKGGLQATMVWHWQQLCGTGNNFVAQTTKVGTDNKGMAQFTQNIFEN